MTEGARRVSALVATVALVAGCGTAGRSPSAEPAGSLDAGARIPQASVTDIEVADESARVDLLMPTFSNPTKITNPYFPVARESSNLLVGTVEDQAFRTEVTVLPTTRMVEWEGQQIETVVSQYAAFLDGQIHEIAYDLYAQADDGAVWYFGEDVFNFADGAIENTEGTWHAGVDGPAGMIMPGDPQVGDVYRPENIPGLVFEEVVVRSTDETVDGPFGPIEGALLVEEHHMDGEIEEKQFAPGYGEFYTDAGGDVEALALAVPPDGDGTETPRALSELSDAAATAVDAALADDLDAVAAAAADAGSARETLGVDDVPTLLAPLLDESIVELRDASDAEAAADAAIGLARLAGDLRLLHEPIADVDLDRLRLWGAQLVADSRAGDMAAVSSDGFAVTCTAERLTPDGPLGDLTALVEAMETAIADEDLDAVGEVGERIRELGA